ncbi:hypothetical protein DIPPA_26017 [Diplonema papillatum]|nr:hypothetical protein DIPPA_26017 [Diplonema papillatum]
MSFSPARHGNTAGAGASEDRAMARPSLSPKRPERSPRRAECLCGRELVMTQPGYTRRGVAGTLVGDWVCDLCGKTGGYAEARRVCAMHCDFDACTTCTGGQLPPRVQPAASTHLQSTLATAVRTTHQPIDPTRFPRAEVPSPILASAVRTTHQPIDPTRVSRAEVPSPIPAERTAVSPPPPLPPRGLAPAVPLQASTPPAAAAYLRSTTPPGAKPFVASPASGTAHAGPHEGNPCRHCFGKVFATDRDVDPAVPTGIRYAELSPESHGLTGSEGSQPGRNQASDPHYFRETCSSASTERPPSPRARQEEGRAYGVFDPRGAEGASAEIADSHAAHSGRLRRMCDELDCWRADVPPQAELQRILAGGDVESVRRCLKAWLKHFLAQAAAVRALRDEQRGRIRNARHVFGEVVATVGDAELQGLFGQLCREVDADETERLRAENRAMQLELHTLREKLKDTQLGLDARR